MGNIIERIHYQDSSVKCNFCKIIEKHKTINLELSSKILILKKELEELEEENKELEKKNKELEKKNK